ncbi:MAG: general secretion pathway protein GspB [Burkholderiales bacterium]|nr:general secretion pathway protein GspB [Burkholderiales bacterium]
MSYILDALKKAEAERQLGAVPNLHMQPVSTLSYRATGARGKTWLIAAALSGLIAVALLAWLQPWRAPSGEPSISPPVAALPSTQVSQVAAENPPQSQTEIAPIAPTGPATLSSEAATIESAPQAPPVATRKPAVKEKPAPVHKQRNPDAVAQAPKPNAAPVAAPAPVQAPHAQEQAPLSARELPENIQRELPNVSIGGYIYSDNPRERQLLANKRLLREGEEAAPGLVLEKMLPRAAVFNYKGHRYQVAY